jgi:hypothetical protein
MSWDMADVARRAEDTAGALEIVPSGVTISLHRPTQPAHSASRRFLGDIGGAPPSTTGA